MTMIHIMTHTHWDREWFLLSEVTNEWLEDLFDRLLQIIDRQPDYRYLLDGQTLMIEDYLNAHPEQRTAIQQRAEAGNLLIGPYYGQIDWRVVSEESLMRNLEIGISDAKQYGNLMPFGWLMDNFGHCSQAPQIHKLFGIDEVFIWRGPVFDNDEISSDFSWQGSDGSQVQANYLMSGYRNFYNLTDSVEYLDQRIEQLKKMLEPFTPHKQLIFLSGYDLDVFPEDPFQFLQEGEGFVRSTPERYSRECKLQCAKEQEHNKFCTPTIRGELYSGKYACVFPGSLSARTYLKVENALIERILTFYLEPLQAIVGHPPEVFENSGSGASGTESLWRDLLKTQLHDNIGGVGVDQIHDEMEKVYSHLYSKTKHLISDALAYLPSLIDLQIGTYIFMPSPFEYKNVWIHGNGKNYLVNSSGSGFYKLDQEHAVANLDKEVDSFRWDNEYYRFEIGEERIRLNGNPVGELSLEKDAGDTYNADPEPFSETPNVTILSLKIQEKGESFAQITLKREILHEDIVVRTEEEMFMNNTPVLEWKLSVHSTGKNYRLRFIYDTQDTHSGVFAKMPYSIDQRPRKDENYFGRDIPNELQPVLLAAREIGAVADFPFQGFAALSDTNATKAVFGRGLREYEVDETGKICITLKRSVEWIARPSLRTRIGDAGPNMYVPSAKDERTTQFELALIDITAHVRSSGFLKWFYLFEYGCFVFENKTFDGKHSSVRMWKESLPWSGIRNLENRKSLIRVYNPYDDRFKFSDTYTGTDPFGQTAREVSSIAQNKIEQFIYEPPPRPDSETAPSRSQVDIIDFPEWPVSEDHSSIEDSILVDLRNEAEALKQEQSQAKQRVSKLLEQDDALRYHRTKHTVIRLEREILEIELSLLLNELKIREDTSEIREKIRDVGKQLNLARRQRRTYDYILSLFENRTSRQRATNRLSGQSISTPPFSN